MMLRLHKRQNRWSVAQDEQYARCRHGIQSTVRVCSPHATHIVPAMLLLVAAAVWCCKEIDNNDTDDALAWDRSGSTRLLSETSSWKLIFGRFVAFSTPLVEIAESVVSDDSKRVEEEPVSFVVADVCSRCIGDDRSLIAFSLVAEVCAACNCCIIDDCTRLMEPIATVVLVHVCACSRYLTCSMNSIALSPVSERSALSWSTQSASNWSLWKSSSTTK